MALTLTKRGPATTYHYDPKPEEAQAAPIKKSHTVKLVYIPGANRG